MSYDLTWQLNILYGRSYLLNVKETLIRFTISYQFKIFNDYIKQWLEKQKKREKVKEMWSPIDGQNTCSFRRGQVNRQIKKKRKWPLSWFLSGSQFSWISLFSNDEHCEAGGEYNTRFHPQLEAFDSLSSCSEYSMNNTSKSHLAVEWWQKKWKLASSPLAGLRLPL